MSHSKIRWGTIITLSNFQAIGRTIAEMQRFYGFQCSRRPPLWICCMPIWTTHEEYLVVFIAVQNLVRIDAVVSIICEF